MTIQAPARLKCPISPQQSVGRHSSLESCAACLSAAVDSTSFILAPQRNLQQGSSLREETPWRRPIPKLLGNSAPLKMRIRFAFNFGRQLSPAIRKQQNWRSNSNAPGGHTSCLNRKVRRPDGATATVGRHGGLAIGRMNKKIPVARHSLKKARGDISSAMEKISVIGAEEGVQQHLRRLNGYAQSLAAFHRIN